jgi:hypothetical protein
MALAERIKVPLSPVVRAALLEVQAQMPITASLSAVAAAALERGALSMREEYGRRPVASGGVVVQLREASGF